jgi:hypothetical protein
MDLTTFQVRDPSVVPSETQAMIAGADPKPILIQELGYPTDATLGSSLQKQAHMIAQACATYRQCTVKCVRAVNVLFLWDNPQWVAELVTHDYSTRSNAFAAYITTLGLRDRSGIAKPGWDTFVQQIPQM